MLTRKNRSKTISGGFKYGKHQKTPSRTKTRTRTRTGTKRRLAGGRRRRRHIKH